MCVCLDAPDVCVCVCANIMGFIRSSGRNQQGRGVWAVSLFYSIGLLIHNRRYQDCGGGWSEVVWWDKKWSPRCVSVVSLGQEGPVPCGEKWKPGVLNSCSQRKSAAARDVDEVKCSITLHVFIKQWVERQRDLKALSYLWWMLSNVAVFCPVMTEPIRTTYISAVVTSDLHTL